MSIRRCALALCLGVLISISSSFVQLTAQPKTAHAAALTCATETPTAITATNDLITFTLSKTSGMITSLQLQGRELLGNGGVGYWDMNDTFGYFVLGAGTTYAVQCPADGSSIDVSATHLGTLTEPMTVTQHYVLQAGVTGIHIFTVVSHSSTLPADNIAQFRFVLRVDPTIFTNASVEDDPLGAPWREAASTFPTPQQLASSPNVQDATSDLLGKNSLYPRRYYTKYDWSVYYRNHLLHGVYGNGFGAWMTMDHNESFNGGPTHQDLTLHQTNTTPVLLNMEQGAHFGGPAIITSGDWTKTYGPYLLYFNTGTDATALRNNALQFANVKWDQSFYDTLGIPGYTPSTERSVVTGRVKLFNGHSMAGGTVVLSDNGTDFQSTWQGYQYWAPTSGDGSFHISGIRPGIYRLSVYRSSYFGDFHIDDVVVDSATTLNLPTMVWTPQKFGKLMWQIGSPDRTSFEFKNGEAFRNYGNQLQFPQQFPNGVNYIIGTSHAADDWNYVQYQQLNGQRQPDWTIQFNLPHPTKPGQTATLTVALAGWSLQLPRPPTEPGSLTISINGNNLPVWNFPTNATDAASYRSACSGGYHLNILQFPASALNVGTNTFSFRINDGGTPTAINNVQYDALRFEIG